MDTGPQPAHVPDRSAARPTARLLNDALARRRVLVFLLGRPTRTRLSGLERGQEVTTLGTLLAREAVRVSDRRQDDRGPCAACLRFHQPVGHGVGAE